MKIAHHNQNNRIRNQKGQGLVEYLIIVAIIGVGSIALMRAVGQNMSTRYAKVVEALGGTVEGNKTADAVTSNMYRKKDLKNFMSGSIHRSRSNNDTENEQD